MPDNTKNLSSMKILRICVPILLAIIGAGVIAFYIMIANSGTTVTKIIFKTAVQNPRLVVGSINYNSSWFFLQFNLNSQNEKFLDQPVTITLKNLKTNYPLATRHRTPLDQEFTKIKPGQEIVIFKGLIKQIISPWQYEIQPILGGANAEFRIRFDNDQNSSDLEKIEAYFNEVHPGL